MKRKSSNIGHLLVCDYISLGSDMECIRGNASATPRLIQMTHVWRYQIVFEGCMKMIMAESRSESFCGIMGQAGQFKSYSAFVFQSIVTRFFQRVFQFVSDCFEISVGVQY